MRLIVFYFVMITSFLSCTKEKNYEALYESPKFTKIASGVTERLTRIQFVNNDIGYISGNKGVVLKTLDAGNTWVRQNTGIETYLSSICFVDQNHGWATGSPTGPKDSTVNTVIVTTDGGVTWSPQTVGGKSTTMYTIKFIDLNNGWIGGSGGLIFHTSNGGVTWEQQSNIDTLGMRAAWVRKNTFAGGRDRPTAGTLKDSRIYFIHAIDKNTLYGLSRRGLVFKTVDGGASWKWIETGSLSSLFGMSSPSSNVSYLCGSKGTMLRLTNDGKFEDVTNQTNPRSFRDLHFVNENYGWGIGDHGYIYKTINGGKYWGGEVDVASVYRLYSCYFTKPHLGFFVGNNGTILKVEDPSKNNNNK